MLEIKEIIWSHFTIIYWFVYIGVFTYWTDTDVIKISYIRRKFRKIFYLSLSPQWMASLCLMLRLSCKGVMTTGPYRRRSVCLCSFKPRYAWTYRSFPRVSGQHLAMSRPPHPAMNLPCRGMQTTCTPGCWEYATSSLSSWPLIAGTTYVYGGTPLTKVSAWR